jgi:hypothetical protein
LSLRDELPNGLRLAMMDNSMSRLRLLLVLGVAFILLLLGLGAGVWWYLFGTNAVSAAELVPANTIFFATIPDAAAIVESYPSSRLKTLLDSPNAQPMRDAMVNWVGQKNVDLLQAFLPNLSGQSFFAITHFEYDHPEQIGFIAAMKPKAGLGSFDAFIDKLKATWPEIIQQCRTGTGTVEGVDYEWIQGPGAPDKICVAKVRGWIVASWGEASLQDWIERFRKKSDTTSLADDLDYRKALMAVGDDPMTLVYVNSQSVMKLVQQQIGKTNPAAGDYLAKKLDSLGGAALATRFENGEIVDRFSLLLPRPAQLNFGMDSAPCPFETLKFTGPDTRFSWASSINWKQCYQNLKEQPPSSSFEHTTFYPVSDDLLAFLQNWVRGAGLDVQQNIVDALGSEISVQAEWSQDATWPEVGLFVKLDKPDDFKPTITAIIESARKLYATSAVIQELNSNGQTFAALQFVQSSPITPTITENGPYLGIFLTENQAVRSFQRNEALGLTHQPDFNRQVGDKRNGAAQIFFLDSPSLLDRAYRTIMPDLSLAGAFKKNLEDLIKGRNMPADLTWLAPMGTWSCVITTDEDGIQGYSASGIGNQGSFLAGPVGGVATAVLLQTMSLLPKPAGASNSMANSGASQISPQAGSGDSANAANPPLSAVGAATGASAIIYLAPNGKIYFDQTTVAADQIGDFLRAKKAANASLKLLVHVDINASLDLLSTVMDAAASAGFGVLPTIRTSGGDSIPPATSSNPTVAPGLADNPTTPSSAPAPPPAASINNTPITPSNRDGTPNTPGPPPPQ